MYCVVDVHFRLSFVKGRQLGRFTMLACCYAILTRAFTCMQRVYIHILCVYDCPNECVAVNVLHCTQFRIAVAAV